VVSPLLMLIRLSLKHIYIILFSHILLLVEYVNDFS